MLHQLDDQKASAANVTKSQRLIQHASGHSLGHPGRLDRGDLLAAGPGVGGNPAERVAGPHHGAAGGGCPRRGGGQPAPGGVGPGSRRNGSSTAERPAIIAGGGTRRGRAEKSLLSIAEKLRAPVICTPGGNGAFPWNHELSLQSWIEDQYMTELLEDADVLIVIGSSLGEVTSNYFTFEPRGRIIQIDAEPRVLESNRPGLGIRADAGQALAALDGALRDRRRRSPPDWHGTAPKPLVKETLAKVTARLESRTWPRN